MLTAIPEGTVPRTEDNKESGLTSGVRKQISAIGFSGTEIHAGYFSEEYLQLLRGKRGARTYDEMRRSEPQISMILKGVTNPIKGANWTFEAAKTEDVADAQLHADLMEEIFKVGIDWDTALVEIFSFCVYGYSVFEPIHSVVLNHPKFGDFNGLKSLAFRSPKTIERWNLEKHTGNLLSLEQIVFSDVGQSCTIPGQNLLVFSLDKEGDNYEGISLLRPMYGPWFRKNLYLKLAAIGAEKNAIGTPKAKVPAGKEKTDEFKKLLEILEAFTAHESAYITYPEGWEIDIIKGEFDGSELKELIVLENTEMANAAVANFLTLGMNSSGGAYALGSDLSDLMLASIQCLADFACGVINRQLIPNLVKLNFGPQQAYPKLKCTGINDKAGKELADIIGVGIDKRIIKPDDKLDTFFRKQFKLPDADPTTSREAPTPAPGFGGNTPAPAPAPTPAPTLPEPEIEEPEVEETQLAEGTRLQLAETYKAEFKKRQVDTKTVMQEGLRQMLDAMKKKIEAEYKKATPQARLTLGTKIEAVGVNKYRDVLREALAETANLGLLSARKEIPGGKKIKLSESIQLAAPKGGYYEALPTNVKKRIVDVQASLIANTQSADLEKIVSFQYTTSANSTADLAQILRDIEEKAGEVIEGATGSGLSLEAAASNAVSTTLNQARLDFFFEPEVLETIESFTFVNEDPVSEICQELDGTTWAADDPAVDRYSPPLHHNCKSRLVPNIKGDEGNPEVESGPTSISKAAASSITLHECESHSYRLTKGA